MPVVHDLPPTENSFPASARLPEKQEWALSFADLVVDQSLLPVNVKIVRNSFAAGEFLSNELLTALQCEV